MTDRKTAYRNTVDAAGGPKAAHGGRGYRRGSRRDRIRNERRDRMIERVQAQMPALLEEFPELELYRDHLGALPDGKQWSAMKVGGVAFLLDSYSRKGGSPTREGMESWSVRHGQKPDYLYRLTRREGFLKAYYRMGLIRTLMRGGQLDQKTLDTAMESPDPRWMDQAQRLVRAAQEGLGLKEEAAGAVTFDQADAVYRRTVTITEERRGARPDPAMALQAQEGGDGEA